MYLKHVAAICLAVLVSACDGEGGPPLKYGAAELDHSSLKPRKLSGRVLAQGDYLARPGSVIRLQNYLLVLDDLSDSVLHVVSAADGRRIRSLGRKGEGPGEFKGAWSLEPHPTRPTSAWVYDIALGRLTRVDLDSAYADPEMIRTTGTGTAIQPVWVSDTAFASIALSPGGRLSFFSKGGEFKGAAGPLAVAEDKIPAAVSQQAWTGMLVSNPGRGLLALVTQHADQLELYAADGKLVRKVRGPFRFDPQFTVENVQGQAIMGSGESMRFGYMSAAATGDKIYALFSGRTREAFGPESSFSRFVHVYDWNGNLEQVLELDTAILSIEISPDQKWIYGIRHDPEPAIMAFELER